MHRHWLNLQHLPCNPPHASQSCDKLWQILDSVGNSHSGSEHRILRPSLNRWYPRLICPIAWGRGYSLQDPYLCLDYIIVKNHHRRGKLVELQSLLSIWNISKSGKICKVRQNMRFCLFCFQRNCEIHTRLHAQCRPELHERINSVDVTCLF